MTGWNLTTLNEDVSPIKKNSPKKIGDFPASHVSFGGMVELSLFCNHGDIRLTTGCPSEFI